MNDKIIKDINHIILAALNIQQKRLVDKILEHNKDQLLSRYDDIFGAGVKRIYLPEPVIISKKDIIDFFVENNSYSDNHYVGILRDCISMFFDYLNRPHDRITMTTMDYYVGKVKIGNREYNIGKLLNDIKRSKDKLIEYYETKSNEIAKEILDKMRESTKNGEPDPIIINSMTRIANENYNDFIEYLNRIDGIIKVFNARFNINSVKDMECLVVISRDPYDIAGMSTDRRWKSCMRLPKHRNDDGGQYRYYVMADLLEGTLIAYLIEKNDRDIDNPYARVLIKPFINKNNDVYLAPEDKVYYDESYLTKDHTDNFLSIVQNWVDEQQQELEGNFYANPNLYHDNDKFTAKTKSSRVKYSNILISDAIYDSIDWDKTLPNGKKRFDYGISNYYMELIIRLIEFWNKHINIWNSIVSKFDSNITNAYGAILLHEMTPDDFANLNFKIRLKFETNKIADVSIDEIKNFIEAVDNTEEITDLVELLRTIKRIKKEKKTNSSVETYDVVVVRHSDDNNNNLKDVTEEYNRAGNYVTYSDDYTHKDLFDVYIVNTGESNYKNNCLIKLNVELTMSEYDINRYYISALSSTFSTNDFDNAFSRDILNYDTTYIGIVPEFDEYLDKSINYSKKSLLDAVYRIIADKITIYCNSDVIIDELNLGISSEYELLKFYKKHGISYEHESNIEDRYSKLEREVFDED